VWLNSECDENGTSDEGRASRDHADAAGQKKVDNRKMWLLAENGHKSLSIHVLRLTAHQPSIHNQLMKNDI
jgi:hypothetical protein